MTTPDDIADDAVFTMAEAAALCRISVKLFRSHRDKGDIPYILFGQRTYRFEGRAVKAFRRKLTQVSPCPSTKPRNRRSGSTISSSTVIGFREARKKRLEDARRR